MALTLTEDEDVTNGLIRVTYDPAVLTYVDTTTLIGNFAVKAEDGVILFDYATAKAILAGNVLATMNFTFDADSIDTEIMVETLQRNADTTITGETTTVPVSFSRAGPYGSRMSIPTCRRTALPLSRCKMAGLTFPMVRKISTMACSMQTTTGVWTAGRIRMATNMVWVRPLR